MREANNGVREILPAKGVSAFTFSNFSLETKESLKRRAMNFVAPAVLNSLQAFNRLKLKIDIKPEVDTIVLGDRWASGNAWSEFKKCIPLKGIESVLVQGCCVGDSATQKWLRAGIKRVCGIDLFDLTEIWNKTVPMLESTFDAKVKLQQGSVDEIPFETASFDVVTSEAVYEHVRNLDLAVKEMSRVLKPGGIAFHAIGPLYYSFSGDHCISCYGKDSGYDHLVKDEENYRRMIDDTLFFATKEDPNCNFWARLQMFSFATMQDYFDAFEPYFERLHVTVVICPLALEFRKMFPIEWKHLKTQIREQDLLIKGLYLVAKNRGEN